MTEPDPGGGAQTAGAEEEQHAEVMQAMTCADHFLGLLNFERAADKLEEQLVKLCEESSPHRHSDLHVEVLAKYGGVLWWDGDLEGAVDAFTAADEVLAARPGDEPRLRLRRTELWGQLAQVHRACGNLDAADRHLSEAVNVLNDMVAADDARGAIEWVDALRDAQAALGQVCVQKEDFARAEKLYIAAFASDDAGMINGVGTEVGADAEA